jgi:hypothetical protein
MIAEIVGQSAYPLLRIFVSSQNPPPPSLGPPLPRPGMPEPPMSRLRETLAQLKKKKKP